MKLRSINAKILLFLLSVLIIAACSSSNTVRFGKKTPDEDTDKSSVRFTSADDSMIVDLNLDLKDPSDLPAEEPDIEISSLLTTAPKEENIDVSGI